MRRLILLLAIILSVLTTLVTLAVRAQPRDSLLVYQSASNTEMPLILINGLDRSVAVPLAILPPVERFVAVNSRQVAVTTWLGIDEQHIVFWDGENPPRMIETESHANTSPAVAHDGRVAFVSRDSNPPPQLWVWNSADNTLDALGGYQTGYASPAWSPDGRLAYINHQYQLVIVEPDGTRTVITSNVNPRPALAWSADGRLAFLKSMSDSNFRELRVMQPDGSMETIGVFDIIDTIAWSADGRLAFTAYNPNNNDIFVWSHGQTLLNISQHSADDFSPVWSADGRLAFTSARNGDQEIYVWQADQPLKNISTHPAMDSEPAWSADGRLAFTSMRDGNAEIYLWSEGNHVQNRSNSPQTYDHMPRWLDPPRP